MKKNNIEYLCPIRDVIGRLGDKWSLLVLVILYQNKRLRFTQIHRNIDDISQRMLTVTLRSLEADGLVSRYIYPEVPPRVEYELTETGQSLIPHVQSLVDWALTNMPAIINNRRQSEIKTNCLDE
jgi:DNA-binding HxlR family transcriptional regulator